MSGAGLRESQFEMARYLRSPSGEGAPQGIEQRRLDIYRRLVYNNIEGFISGGFPVLRSLYQDTDWHELVRAFVEQHRCHSPYFLEISQEFLHYLLEEHRPRPVDPPFMTELAHYEWVELALDVADEETPPAARVEDPLAVVPQLSPLAWLLSYRFPVHRIGPGNRPQQAGDPTYLVVYRDHQEQVQFMELNALTARLLELTRDNVTASGAALLDTLAGEAGMVAGELQGFGAELLADLLERAVLMPAGPAPRPR